MHQRQQNCIKQSEVVTRARFMDHVSIVTEFTAQEGHGKSPVQEWYKKTLAVIKKKKRKLSKLIECFNWIRPNHLRRYTYGHIMSLCRSNVWL